MPSCRAVARRGRASAGRRETAFARLRTAPRACSSTQRGPGRPTGTPGSPASPPDPPDSQPAVASREPGGARDEDAAGAGIRVVRALHRDGDVPVAAAAELLDGATEEISS